MREFTYIIYIWLPDPDVYNIEQHYYLGLIQSPKRQIALEKAKEKWGIEHPNHNFCAYTKTSGTQWVYNQGVINWLQAGNKGFFRPKSNKTQQS